MFVAFAAPELFLTPSNGNLLATRAKSGKLARSCFQDSGGTTRGQGRGRVTSRTCVLRFALAFLLPQHHHAPYLVSTHNPQSTSDRTLVAGVASRKVRSSSRIAESRFQFLGCSRVAVEAPYGGRDWTSRYTLLSSHINYGHALLLMSLQNQSTSVLDESMRGVYLQGDVSRMASEPKNGTVPGVRILSQKKGDARKDGTWGKPSFRTSV